jgi:hypothetical protein
MDLSIQDDLWWGTRLRLPSWAGYQSRLGPYGSKDGSAPSDGSVALIFAPEARGIEPLTAREMQLIAWFEENEASVSEAVKAGIIDWCSPHSAERMTTFDFDDTFPVIADETGLRENVGLYAINIHQLDVGGVPYLGYEFGCDWDELGLGVLMHGTRVVEVGLADTAILNWIAVEDAKRDATTT